MDRSHLDLVMSCLKKWKPAIIADPDNITFEKFEPDGSSRIFYRISCQKNSLAIGVMPAGNTDQDMAEAHSFAAIGAHLFATGVAVPEIYHFDRESGLVLLEDLGNCRLHDLAPGLEDSGDSVGLLKKVVDKLLQMQFDGINAFQGQWCWDTSEYDQGLMIKRESEYFERAFLHDVMHLNSPSGLHEEFQELARRAGRGRMRCFLHRDFQSRNIMIRNEEPFFIDFQGGRVGPPGYDLASFLIDPYLDLQEDAKDELYDYYVSQLERIALTDKIEFDTTYPYLALQRNLQIVGAFSFLSRVRKKMFFSRYLLPAFNMIEQRLTHNSFEDFTVLRSVVEKAGEKIQKESLLRQAL